jgi:hypothetical protein
MFEVAHVQPTLNNSYTSRMQHALQKLLASAAVPSLSSSTNQHQQINRSADHDHVLDLVGAAAAAAALPLCFQL